MSRKLLSLVVIICVFTIVTGCGMLKNRANETSDNNSQIAQEDERNDFRKTICYYVNESDLLVPVTRELPWTEGIAKSALENLIDNPRLRLQLNEKGLKPSLPAGTKVNGMTIHEGTAKVDLSSEFLNYPDKTSEKNALDALVYTLTEFPSIERVQLYIDGEPLKKCPNGNKVEEMFYREKINLEASGRESESVPVTLFFKSVSNDVGKSYFVPVTRMVEKKDNVIKKALNELIAGPLDKENLLPVLPKDTKVIDVKQQDSEVIVDFSKDIQEYGGGINTEQTLVNSIVLTVLQFDGVDSVSLLVEGKADVLPEGTVLDIPILKPVYINHENI